MSVRCTETWAGLERVPRLCLRFAICASDFCRVHFYFSVLSCVELWLDCDVNARET